MKTVEIYGQRGCGYCVKALRFVQENSLPFVYRDIANLPDREEMFRRNPRAATVPQIFIGDKHIGGFDDLAGHTIPQLQQMIGE